MVGQDVWGSFSALYPLRCQNVKLRCKGVWIFLGLGSPCSMNWRQASSYTCITWLPQSWSFPNTKSPAWVSLALRAFGSNFLITHLPQPLSPPQTNPSPSPFRFTMGFSYSTPRTAPQPWALLAGPGLYKASDILCPFPQPPNLCFSQSEFCKPLSRILDGADSLGSENQDMRQETNDAMLLPLWPPGSCFPGWSQPQHRTTPSSQDHNLWPGAQPSSLLLLPHPFSQLPLVRTTARASSSFPSSNSSSSLLPECVLSSLTDCITLGGNLPTHSPAVLSMDWLVASPWAARYFS